MQTRQGLEGAHAARSSESAGQEQRTEGVSSAPPPPLLPGHRLALLGGARLQERIHEEAGKLVDRQLRGLRRHPRHDGRPAAQKAVGRESKKGSDGCCAWERALLPAQTGRHNGQVQEPSAAPRHLLAGEPWA